MGEGGGGEKERTKEERRRGGDNDRRGGIEERSRGKEQKRNRSRGETVVVAIKVLKIPAVFLACKLEWGIGEANEY